MPVAQESPDAVWTDLHRRMTGFVRRRIDDPHAAEDVAQEILLRLHRSLGTLRDEDRLHAFAYRIARNAITDHHRSKRELVIAPEEVATHLDVEPATEDDESEAWRELACCLEPLIGRLAAPYRDALLLTDLGDLSQVQAAEHAGLTVPGMKARVQRARAQLAESLAACCSVPFGMRGPSPEIEPPGQCGCSAGEPTTDD